MERDDMTEASRSALRARQSARITRAVSSGREIRKRLPSASGRMMLSFTMAAVPASGAGRGMNAPHVKLAAAAPG